MRDMREDTEDLKELKEDVREIRADMSNMKEQMKMMQKGLSKTDIATPEEPTPGELYYVCFCFSWILWWFKKAT